MNLIKRIFANMCYRWCKVDEYLSRCREDWPAASHDLNRALEWEQKWRGM